MFGTQSLDIQKARQEHAKGTLQTLQDLKNMSTAEEMKEHKFDNTIKIIVSPYCTPLAVAVSCYVYTDQMQYVVAGEDSGGQVDGQPRELEIHTCFKLVYQFLEQIVISTCLYQFCL